MLVNEAISASKRKQGVYRVNGNEYSNKFQALENCRVGQYPHWDFNEAIFEKYDWSIEPIMDLYELYRLRAIQLREKYDHVILYYSGGIDSTCVLRSFLDNDIKIDGVILYGTWSIDRRKDMVTNQEQRLVAYPYLQKVLKKQNFPIHFLDTSPYFKNYNDPSWIYTVSQFSPQVYTFNFFYQDPWVQNFLMKGSTCFVKGIDKPRIAFDSKSNKWVAGFLDVSNMAAVSGFLNSRQDWDIQEYFYWTPDLPELPIKQAHVVYNYIKNLVNSKQIFDMHAKVKFDTYEYNKITDPLMYGRYVAQEVGGERPYFHIRKGTIPNSWPKDEWFYSKELQDETYVNLYYQGIAELGSKIDKFYYNDPTKSLGETDVIGCWSKMYPLEKDSDKY